jgi:hypothetical protein
MASKRRTYRRKRRSSTKTRRKSTRSKRRRTTTRRKPAVISKFIAAQLNPFDERVLGVKIPDENTVPSVGFATDDERTLSTGSSYGCNAVVLRHTMAKSSVQTATVVGTTSWTWSASYLGTTDSGDLVPARDTFELMRTCAFGVKISCPLAATTASGFVHVCLVANNYEAESSWDYPTSTNAMAKMQGYRKFTLSALTQKPLFVTSKPIDNNAYRYFNSASDLAASADNMELHHEGWQSILVAVTQTNNPASVLNIEKIVHREGIPKAGNFLVGSTPSPSYPNVMRDAANIAASTDPTHLGEGNSVFSEFAGRVNTAAQGAFRDYVMPYAEEVGRRGMANLMDLAGQYLHGRGAQLLIGN